ncbi:MAG: uncharacterized protein QOI16_3666, partial [Pseudonocardiales bacterium]|nr:uncharacterized protein [Pseudonocardiales bacterium]
MGFRGAPTSCVDRHTRAGVEADERCLSLSVAWRRRRYDDRYDPYDPYDSYRPPPGRWERRRYYRPAPGGTCLRDACLLETGCCIGEGLDGNCLVLALLAAPALIGALTHPTDYPRGTEPVSGWTARRLIAAIRVYQRQVSAGRPPS